MNPIRINRIGEINHNKYGSEMKIIDYKDCHNIVVKFNNGYTTNATYQWFKKGSVDNPYDKTVYYIGYLGEGKYKIDYEHSKLNTQEYKVWFSMFVRCYDKKYQEKYPTYMNCKVCEKWHNFQVFAKWYDENYYTVDDEVMCLDKDILHKENKIYSPDNCVFVPERINLLFVKNNKRRGNLPIGVSWHKRDKVYVSQCGILENNKRKNKYLGSYNNSTQAFNKYKNFKEKYIKDVANEYKNKIPTNLYDALYSYEVEITD